MRQSHKDEKNSVVPPYLTAKPPAYFFYFRKKNAHHAKRYSIGSFATLSATVALCKTTSTKRVFTYNVFFLHFSTEKK